MFYINDLCQFSQLWHETCLSLKPKRTQNKELKKKGTLMKWLALALVAVGGLVLSGAETAEAGHRDHDRLHNTLEHRSFHRYQTHQNGHRYRLTYRQHNGLHDALEHDSYHDRLQHRSVHRSYQPTYRGRSGFGISTRRFSFWFGR